MWITVEFFLFLANIVGYILWIFIRTTFRNLEGPNAKTNSREDTIETMQFSTAVFIYFNIPLFVLFFIQKSYTVQIILNPELNDGITETVLYTQIPMAIF